MGTLDRYTCEQVFRLLDDYVDRELGAEEVRRVEEHLATCVQCADEYEFEVTLLGGLKEKIRRMDVPESAVEKVRAALRRRLDGRPAQDDGEAAEASS